MLVKWMGEKYEKEQFLNAANAIDSTVDDLLKDSRNRTADLGGPLGTQAFASLVAEKLNA
jgi:3-isopropylmalate dehydrogenase